MPDNNISCILWHWWRLVVAHANLQRVRYVDLFGCWTLASASRALAQISSRFCSLSELFPFPFDSLRASDFFPQPYCGCLRNPTVLFPFASTIKTATGVNDSFVTLNLTCTFRNRSLGWVSLSISVHYKNMRAE